MADVPAGSIRPDEGGPANSGYDATSSEAVAGYEKLDDAAGAGTPGHALEHGDHFAHAMQGDSIYKQV